MKRKVSFIIFFIFLYLCFNLFSCIKCNITFAAVPIGSYSITVPATLTQDEVAQVSFSHNISEYPMSINISTSESIVLTEVESYETVNIDINFEPINIVCDSKTMNETFYSNISLEEKDIMYGTWTGVIEYEVITTEMVSVIIAQPANTGYQVTNITDYTLPTNITFLECSLNYDTNFVIEEETGYVMYVDESSKKWSYLYGSRSLSNHILSTDVVGPGLLFVKLQDIESSSLLSIQKSAENIDGDLDIEEIEQENDLEENQNDIKIDNEENIDNPNNMENIENIESSDLIVKEEQEEFIEDNQENSDNQTEEDMSVDEEELEEELQLDIDIIEKEEESELEDNESDDSNSENEEENLENNDVIIEIKEEETLIDE